MPKSRLRTAHTTLAHKAVLRPSGEELEVIAVLRQQPVIAAVKTSTLEHQEPRRLPELGLVGAHGDKEPLAC